MSKVNSAIKGDVRRNFFTLAVDVSEDGSSEPEFFTLGYKVEDYSVDLEVESTDITDVLGDNYTSVDKITRKITFDAIPVSFNIEGQEKYDKFMKKMFDQLRNDKYEEMSRYKALLVYGFFGEEGAYEADYYNSCTIIPSSVGGSAWVGLSFEVSLGGEKKSGTADSLKGDVNFTPEA